MLALPEAIPPVLNPFATLFRTPAWRKAQVLLVGAILAPGQRTVASELRVMGLGETTLRPLSSRPQPGGMNRAAWPPLQVAHILLSLLIRQLGQGDGPLVFGIYETVERRGGPKISARGIYRDAVRSSRSYPVKVSGLRWVCLMWLGHIPWAGRYWALPFLAVLGRCWLPRNGIFSRGDALPRSSPAEPVRWFCNSGAGCPAVPWCWWETAATPSWTCCTSANRCRNRLPS